MKTPKRNPRSRVEETRGGLGHSASPRFPSPLIEPTCGFPASGFARGKVKNSFPASPLLLLLARFGHSMGCARTSALTPKADVRGPMSAYMSRVMSRRIWWAAHKRYCFSSGRCALRGPCDDVHVSCEDRINLYPAAPIRLATMLNAWIIAEVGWG